jgi:hypothetical protein
MREQVPDFCDLSVEERTKVFGKQLVGFMIRKRGWLFRVKQSVLGSFAGTQANVDALWHARPGSISHGTGAYLHGGHRALQPACHASISDSFSLSTLIAY